MNYSHRYRDVLRDELENDEFRKKYEDMEEDFVVAKEIIQLRLQKGWTQKELAEQAHTSQPTIARLESGNYRNVSLSFLRKLGKALDAVPVVHMQPVHHKSRRTA